MSDVKILVGVPGAGKSTIARQYEQNGWAVVERDRIRMELFGKWYGVDESRVTFVQKERIRNHLLAGDDVIISDTNITEKTRDGLIEFCSHFGANVSVVHVGGGLLFDDLQARNLARDDITKIVPIDVMRSMYASYRDQFPLYAPQHDVNKPDAFVFDIDGTLADMTGVRGPFDWSKVGLDKPHADVIKLAQEFHSIGYKILIVSGRDGSCRYDTAEWLLDNKVPMARLFMRNAGCCMRDSAVKHDIYHRDIAPHYNVMGVFDDRDQVVRMWRSMGLRCYQVAEGNF